VSCAAGIIDILTTDTIYEVKLNLTRDNIFEAVGQAMIYRECVRPWARIIIVGIATKDTEKTLSRMSTA
jgi:threonine dehydrogenase-like Zn-dependent dehydrogenase